MSNGMFWTWRFDTFKGAGMNQGIFLKSAKDNWRCNDLADAG